MCSRGTLSPLKVSLHGPCDFFFSLSLSSLFTPRRQTTNSPPIDGFSALLELSAECKHLAVNSQFSKGTKQDQ